MPITQGQVVEAGRHGALGGDRLMGGDVAPRRAFIEHNALDLKNLDI